MQLFKKLVMIPLALIGFYGSSLYASQGYQTAPDIVISVENARVKDIRGMRFEVTKGSGMIGTLDHDQVGIISLPQGDTYTGMFVMLPDGGHQMLVALGQLGTVTVECRGKAGWEDPHKCEVPNLPASTPNIKFWVTQDSMKVRAGEYKYITLHIKAVTPPPASHT